MTSIRQKLWLGFGGQLLVMVCVSVLTLVVLTRYSHALERLFHDNYNSVLFCDAMKSSLNKLDERAQRTIWRSPSASAIDAADARRKFTENLENERGNCTLVGELDRTNRLTALWNGYLTNYQQFDSAPADRQSSIYREKLLGQSQQMEELAQEISDMNMANMMSVDGQVKKTLLAIRNTLLVLIIAGTLLAAVVVSGVSATILRPLRILTSSAGKIESGNLDMQVPVHSRDEIGQLAAAFNSMAAKLREFRQSDHDRLVRAKQTTQLAIDSLPDAVFVIGPTGAIEISNRAARNYFGIEPGITVGKLSLDWLTRLFEKVRQTGQSVEPQGYRSAIQSFQEKQERFLLPRAEPMFREGNTFIGVTVILVDVTGLRSADEAKSDLVSTVSHELRTPLTSIRMALNMLANGKFGTLDPKQAKLLKVAADDSDRLNRIVENLLSMSRMESGRAQYQLRPMPPAEIVSQAVDPMRPAFQEKQISLHIDLPAQLPNVLADPGAINSALTNLLSNALKFTPAGGQVNISCTAADEFIAFTVADTGCGIPEQYASRIFEKFFRVPRPDGPSGAGLGLALAKEIITLHGGTLTLCPTTTPGSTFRFTLRKFPQTSGATTT